MKSVLSELQGKRTSPTPVWLMRQAGRYLPEYRKIRAKADFLTMCRTPELACEITLQPITRLDVDAAIIFADILLPLVPMGLDLKFVENEGPVFSNPVRTSADIENLRIPDTDEETAFLAESLKLVRAELAPEKTLIGFSGAPFTLACYMVEGRGSKDFARLRGMINDAPEDYHALLTKITDTVKNYVHTQIKAGAEVIQIFDTWGGILSREEYGACSHRYSAEIIDFAADLGVPVIHFVKNSNPFLEDLGRSKAACVSLDWQIGLNEADKRLNHEKALQGNFDPDTLFKEKPDIELEAKRILDQAKGLKGHIFNLGHGILPKTPVDNVKFLVDLVHSAQ